MIPIIYFQRGVKTYGIPTRFHRSLRYNFVSGIGLLRINIQRYTIMAKRKYNDSDLDYEFMFVERRNEQLPQCVVCH